MRRNSTPNNQGLDKYSNPGHIEEEIDVVGALPIRGQNSMLSNRSEVMVIEPEIQSQTFQVSAAVVNFDKVDEN